MTRRLRIAAPVAALAVLGLASIALASGGGAEGHMTLEQILWELGIKVLDVAIIAFLGFKYLSKPITGLMESRSAAVRQALDEAGAARREAEAKLKEFQEKTARIEAEMETLRKESCVEIDKEQKILLEEANASAARVRQHAEETIRQELAKARAELHREAALLTVRIATDAVRQQINDADRKRLVGEYAKEMETVR
jgi:F-type H+-transporting ATPase subunit b